MGMVGQVGVEAAVATEACPQLDRGLESPKTSCLVGEPSRGGDRQETQDDRRRSHS
jgi:hypothetical protein